MKTLIISIFMFTSLYALEGESAILITGGPNFSDMGEEEGVLKRAGIGTQVGYEKGFNDQTDIGLRVNYSKHTIEDIDMQLYGVSLITMYSPYNGDIRPRFGGLIGIQQGEHLQGEKSGVSNSFFNLGASLQCVFDFKGPQDIFIEAQPGVSLGVDPEATIQGFTYINILVGVTFGLAS